MASEKLRKYLAYYQKVLKEDPENIEARLRLAAIFREMGRTSHAVEEYVTASKLLAKEGLPLEAIAACKAVLELEPDHSEIQYFLARLFAQVPEATGNAARIAQPVEMPADLSDELAEISDGDEAEDDETPITLSKPKEVGDETRNADVLAEVWEPHESPTKTGLPEDVPDLDGMQLVDDDDDEVTVDQGAADEDDVPTDTLDADDVDRAVENVDTSPFPGDEVPEEIGTEKNDAKTTELDAVERDRLRTRPMELFSTQDVDPEDIVAEMPADDGGPEEDLRITQPAAPSGGIGPDENGRTDTEETFELGVFDLESLGLDEESDDMSLAFLDDLEEPESSEVALENLSETTRPAVLTVSRAELPEIPLFSQLSAHVFMELLRVIDVRKVPTGSVVVGPRKGPDTLFVIVNGTARVTREIDGERVELATLGEGEFFGEFRLLTGRDGRAVVSAKTDLELLAVSKAVINEIADRNPEIWDVLWDFYYARMLNNLLASSEMFRPLEPAERRALADKFVMREVVSDETLLHEGQPCDHLFLILTGEVSVERDLGGITQELATLREGEFFGVHSSLGGEPYTADVRAVRDTMLHCLPADEFRRITDQNPDVARAVQKVIRKRRELNNSFTSGITSYAELGIAKLD